LFVVDEPVTSQDAADALATSKADQVGGSAYEATAICQGSAELRAGTTISVTGVDKLLEGNYTISSSRHEFRQGTYKTTVECSGRQDRTLSGLIANSFAGGVGGGGGQSQRQRINALVVGIVTNVDDPEKLGRVKVKFPWLDDMVESHWARLAMPGAGPDYGLVWVPQVDDEVLVGFEFGDVSRPFVLGGLWNGVDKAPLQDSLVKEGKIMRSGMVSRKGHRLVFDDADDKMGISITTHDENFTIELDEKKGELRIIAKGKKLVIQANEIQIKADAGASFEAGGQMKIKGATVALN
jgi:uncharacterized protein involved in type VI secretion and phage assembly